MRWPWQKTPEIEGKDYALADAGALALFGGWQTKAGPVIGEDAVMKNTVAGAAIRLHSESCMMGVKLYRRGDNGAREEARDHSAYSLIAGFANDWTSSAELRRSMTVEALFRGRSYALVERVNGRPANVFQLPHGAVRRETDKLTGEPFYHLRLEDGQEERRSWTNVLEFCPYGGRALVRDAAEAIGIASQLEQHAAGLFKNGARPGGVVKVKSKLTNEAIDRLRKSFKAAFSGANSGETALLEEGQEFQSLTFSSVDAQFEELLRFYVEEIARALRAPLPLVGDVTRAVWKNVEQLSQVYLTFTLAPLLKAWVESYTRTLIAPDERGELYAEFSLNELVKADLQTRMQAYRTAIEAGVLTRNEARSAENKPPYEGGDEPLSPLAMRLGGGNENLPEGAGDDDA